MSLHGVDPVRRSLVEHLAAVTELASADRAAALWIDEYGPGIVHPHLVLDLFADRPRRSFTEERLREARESGVPGVCEYGPDSAPGGRRTGGSGVVVSLGSDGTRSWFLVADSVSAGPSLAEPVRDEIMFLAGECSGLLLHRDLDPPRGNEAAGGGSFPGYGILRDLDERDADGEEADRVGLRFVVARLPLLLLEEDLALPLDRRTEQVRRAREELAARGVTEPRDAEERGWETVLSAFHDADLSRLGRGLLELGREVESLGHLHGAAELLSAAHRFSTATGDLDEAVESARAAGRTARRLGRWAEAHGWYDAARGVTTELGLPARTALVLDGAAATHRERGNLPAARACLEEALTLAESSGERAALGRVHHGFLGLEQAAGDVEEAIRHGWSAVTLYDDDEDRTRGLAGLAGLLQDMGRLEAAEDAWMLVRHLSRERYYTLYAVDALSHISALRGDAAAFARRAAESDGQGWDSGPATVKADILLHRGLSYRALGRLEEARRWLEETLAFAEERGFSRTLFEAEAALGTLDEAAVDAPTTPEHEEPSPFAASDVEEGLRVMRCDLVGAPA